jgi:hypothetical protein
MATKSTTCVGCSRVFTLSGYAIHLHTTANSQCHQIHQQQLAYIAESDVETSADAHSMSPMSSPHTAIFQEDFAVADVVEDEPMGYYGDDSPADWTEAVDLDDDSFADEDIPDGDTDDEDVAEAAELELGWEPEIEPGVDTEPTELGWEPEVEPEAVLEVEPGYAATQPAPSSPLYWPDSPPNSDIPANAGPFMPNQRYEAEGPLHWGSIRVEQYPNPLAGAPIHETGTQNAYQQSRSGIGASANPYAPFCSKLDWQFACWAKLRGPGSNAITELLQLEGVCTLL